MNLIKRPQAAVRLFLIGDGVACAHKGQRTPEGYYNIERMIRSAARGFEPEDLIEGVQWSSIDLLGQWTLEADRVTTF
jgi:uncharacterized protein involved in oxidation of intracellular sulfur